MNAEREAEIRTFLERARAGGWAGFDLELDLLAALDAERERATRLADLLNRVIDAGVERWHGPKGTYRQPEQFLWLHDWLGLTWDEYTAWVEKRDPFRAGAGSGDT